MRTLLAAAWPFALHALLLSCASLGPAAASSGATAGSAEWQVLNRTNFSSQIRLHPHVLLVVTMPFDISGKILARDSDGQLELVIEDEGLTFGGGGQLTGSPWKGGFSLANDSVFDKIENTSNGNKELCTMQKFHQFESFYASITVIAREYFLSPDIVRFGLITERSLLPSLDVVNEVSSETWFLTIHYLGCTTCSVIVKEGDDIRSLVQSRHVLNIKEVDVDESGAQNNYPSHVSNGALSGSISGMRSKVASSLMKTSISDTNSETAKLNAWASKLMTLGDKMSVMVVNDGESISYRSSSEGGTGNQLYDILTNLLQKTRPGYRSKKKTRISLVSKDANLNLLSDDSKIEVIESLSVQQSQHERTDDSVATSDNFNDDIAEALEATGTENKDDGQASSILEKSPATDPDKHANDLESNATEMDERSKSEASDMSSDIQKEVSYDVYGSSEAGGILYKHKEGKTIENLDVLGPDERKMYTNQEESGSPNQQEDGVSVLGKECRRIEDVIYEDNTFNLDEGSEEGDSKCPPHSSSSSSNLVRNDKVYTEEVTSTIPNDRFAGSFYFSDGGYRLLKTLTGGSRIPSLVIIDPVQQNHYVFPEESKFSYASLQNYFDSFVNQSLPLYHHTASSVIISKELPRPPFVNRDFREANSIPQLTTNSFCPLVFGYRGCNSKKEVLSSNSENITSGWNKDVLVLFSTSWCGFCQRAELIVHRNEEYTMKGFPEIYMIDCTSNECRHLLKSAGMEELYPTLLLFPAENKSPIAYEGGMSMANLIEFLESHISDSRHLLEYKGFLWKKRMPTHHDTPQSIQFHIDDKSSSGVGYDLPIHSDVVRGSILTATEKLGTAVPFDNARVLIVSADSQEGFIGLIMNKQLSWDVFKNLDSSMEPIKQAPLFYGGPVVVQGYHLVSLSKVALEGYIQVVPSVFYGNITATSRVITQMTSGEQSADELWFFLGYSGWGYSQLFDELSDGAWHVSEKPIEHLDWPAT
ncbi:hypothetical protein PR202_ga28853 [Eleusine coracana subsp. coracana]|uniref:Thioredoxin domain-containing protein n=1 Tax=Eleusine coracana subsp. coracana TaxID=191504 RepID=A0AAV5DLE5_ELECO|nr:hypothetical protein PR202_ga28853 [Eleusine coracana subsp. coracana]